MVFNSEMLHTRFPGIIIIKSFRGNDLTAATFTDDNDARGESTTELSLISCAKECFHCAFGTASLTPLKHIHDLIPLFLHLKSGDHDYKW